MRLGVVGGSSLTSFDPTNEFEVIGLKIVDAVPVLHSFGGNAWLQLNRSGPRPNVAQGALLICASRGR